MTNIRSVQSALTELGLYDKYPSFRLNVRLSTSYITSALRNSKLNRREFGDISYLLCNTAYVDMNDFISIQCKSQSKNPNHMIHFYRVYSENQLDNFKSMKFVTNFCSQPIEKILSMFSFINPKHDIPSIIKSNEKLYNILSRILDMFVITELANIFSLIEYFINLQCPKLLFHNYIPRYMGLLSYMISDKCKNFTYEYLSEEYPEEFKSIEYCSTPSLIGCPVKSKRDKIILIICSLWSLFTTSFAKMIHKKSQQDIISNIDIMSIYGVRSFNYIKMDYSVTTYCLTTFFKYKLVNDTEIKDIIEDDIEPIVIINGLNMPTEYKIANTPIEIEI